MCWIGSPLFPLAQSCSTIRESSQVDIHCHVLYAFILAKFSDNAACRVRDIHGKITEEDYLVPTHIQTPFSLLKTLNDKGQVLLLQSSEDQADCFVVLKMAELFHEVNGTLFAPHQFRQHKDFVNSTDMTKVKFSYFQSSELIPKIPEEWGGVKEACVVNYFALLLVFFCQSIM